MKNRVPFYFKVLVVACIGIFASAIWTMISRLNTIDPESKQIKELYSYLGDNILDNCQGMPFYVDGTIDAKSMDKALKMCLAYEMLDYDKIGSDTLKKAKKQDACNLDSDQQFKLDKEGEICSVDTVSTKDLNNAYYRLFGEKIEERIDFNLNSSKACYYDEKESRYVCGNIEVQSLQLAWAPTTFRMISKVKEKGDKIYLYDYFITINNKKCYTTNSGDYENLKCSNKIDKDTDFNSRFVTKYGQKYLHIFEKDTDGNFHWNSSTIVK